MSARIQRIAAHLQSSPTSLGAARTASSTARSVQLVFSPEVRKALDEKRAVVALESTIISHGMPYPQNLETAVQVEDVVRQNGGTPATIAILGGVIHIGLTHSQLEQLAKLGHKCKKVSRRDLAIVLAEKAHGATTVAATMYLAHLAGIRVFVTGGIGGVHRGVESTMDVSADLTELGRTPVAVVSAGVKSILDIPKTLEYLETQGVTVLTVGAKEFPAFFTPHSGCESPHSVANAHEAAKIVASNAQLGLESGMVIAVPVPESEAANAEPVQRAINEALAEANSKHILGRDVTPFLLKRVNELTKGDSLRSNIALVKNNAKVGTQIAVAANAILHSSASSAASAPIKVV